MELQRISFPSIITLSVGGTVYQTSLSVLLKEPGSLLAGFFTGAIPISQDVEGRYFIDRDGYLFSFILNYLRNDELSVPSGESSLIAELKREAEYFKLESLVHQLTSMQDQSSFTFKELLLLVKYASPVQAPLISLVGITLKYLDLSFANFQGADFSHCSVVKVNFFKANMSKALFLESQIHGCNLNETVLEAADFSDACFSGNEMKFANCRDAHFRNTKLGGIDMRGTDLQGADLRRANLLVANMEGCNLALAQLEGANLDGANTRRSKGLSK